MLVPQVLKLSLNSCNIVLDFLVDFDDPLKLALIIFHYFAVNIFTVGQYIYLALGIDVFHELSVNPEHRVRFECLFREICPQDISRRDRRVILQLSENLWSNF